MKRIRLAGVPEHFNLPIKIILEQGNFKANGIDLSFIEQPAGTGVMCNALHSGDLDAAIILTEGAVKDIVHGGKHKIVQFYVKTPLIWGIHVAAHSTLEAEHHIKNRRYAISQFGSGSHLMAAVHAGKMGWEIREEQWVVVRNLHAAKQALLNSQADVFFWEKYTTKPYVYAGEFKRIGEISTRWPCFVISVSDKLLANEIESVHAMLKTINESIHYFMQDPWATSMVSQRYKLPMSDAKEWFQQTTWADAPTSDWKPLSQVVDVLYEFGIIKEKKSIKEIVGRRFQSN